jgi:hypothetical protein
MGSIADASGADAGAVDGSVADDDVACGRSTACAPVCCVCPLTVPSLDAAAAASDCGAMLFMLMLPAPALAGGQSVQFDVADMWDDSRG